MCCWPVFLFFGQLQSQPFPRLFLFSFTHSASTNCRNLCYSTHDIKRKLLCLKKIKKTDSFTETVHKMSIFSTLNSDGVEEFVKKDSSWRHWFLCDGEDLYNMTVCFFFSSVQSQRKMQASSYCGIKYLVALKTIIVYGSQSRIFWHSRVKQAFHPRSYLWWCLGLLKCWIKNWVTMSVGLVLIIFVLLVFIVTCFGMYVCNRYIRKARLEGAIRRGKWSCQRSRSLKSKRKKIQDTSTSQLWVGWKEKVLSFNSTKRLREHRSNKCPVSLLLSHFR